MIRKEICCFIFFVVLITQIACSKKDNNVTEYKSSIFDSANLLTAKQEEDLFSLIKSLEKSIGSQIGVVIINTTHGQNINHYSLTTARKLKLGRAVYDDGILITVAYKDHGARIEVGIGLEKIIKDEVAGRILREEMIPDFKIGNVYEGLYKGVTKIKKLIEDNKELVGQRP